MSNEVLPFISNEVVGLFEEFDGDYLADVIRLWDCDTQDWYDNTTAVFRFESDDLFVWNEMGGLKVKRGPVDTQVFQQESLVGMPEDSCVVWRPDKSFANLIGRAALSAILLESFA